MHEVKFNFVHQVFKESLDFSSYSGENILFFTNYQFLTYKVNKEKILFSGFIVSTTISSDWQGAR